MSMKLNSIQIPFKQDIIQKSSETPVKTASGIDNKNKDNDNKILLTLAALGAVGAGVLAATLAYKKGQTSGLAKGIKKSEQAAKNALSKSEQAIKNALSESKNLDIDLFKKIGNFEKGKAFVNGKGFTGNIHTKNAVVTYDNGVLKQSVIQKFNNKIIKTYNENITRIVTDNSIRDVEKQKDGTIVRTTRKILNGKTNYKEELVDYIKPDGKLTETIVEYKDIALKNRKPASVAVVRDAKTGKIKSIQKRDFTTSSPVRYKKEVVINGKKVTQVFDNGKLSHTFTSEYNPKTGVLKRIEQCYDDNGNAYKGRHIKLVKFKVDGKKRIEDSVMTAFVEKDGKIKDGTIFISTQQKGEIAGDRYGGHGTTLEKAKEIIKEYNLPFEV